MSSNWGVIRDIMKTYSDKIYFFEKYINMIGFELIKPYNSSLPKDVGGRIYYREKIIEINYINAKYAYMCFCHEIGHLILYLIIPIKLQKYIKQSFRENFAIFMGYIISLVTCGKISLKGWLNFNY